LEEGNLDERITLIWNLKKKDGRMINGFVWLSVWTSGGLLLTL
jgi:hypothetical protein